MNGYYNLEDESTLYTETLKDKLTLSPVEKYQKLGRWPYKFFLASALVILTSIQATFISNHFQYNSPTLKKTWVHLFLGNQDPQFDNISFLTVDKFMASLQGTFQRLQNLNSLAILQMDLDHVNVSLAIKYERLYPTVSSGLKFEYTVNLKEGILQPFDMNDAASIKQFWIFADGFTLKIENIEVGSICWNVEIKYDYMFFGYIEAKLTSYGGMCQNNDTNDLKQDGISFFEKQYTNTIVSSFILIFALTDMVLNIKYFYEVVEMYMKNIYLSNRIRKLRVPQYKMKKVYKDLIIFKGKNLTTLKIILKQQKPWDRLTFQEKILFFDLFLPIRIIGNTFQIISSVILILSGFIRLDSLISSIEIIVGIGCFIAWFSISKYMEYVKKLHLTVNILESSIIPVATLLVQFVPVFFAYQVIGLCLFSNSTQFDSLHSSAISLIAPMYGDSLHQIITQTSMGRSDSWAPFYISSYVLIFIFCVSAIMVALVLEQTEQRKEILDIEDELMNQLDFQPEIEKKKLLMVESSVFENRDIDRDNRESITSQRNINGSFADEQRKKSHIQFKTVGRMAILLNKNKKFQSGVSKNTMKKGFNQLANWEIQKANIIDGIKATSGTINAELKLLENDILNDIQLYGLNKIEKNEVLHYYGSKLIQLNMCTMKLLKKANGIEDKLQEVNVSK